MKVTLEFTDEEREEAQRAMRGTDYALVLWDLDQWLREFVRNADETNWPDATQVRAKLGDLMDEREVRFPE